MKRREERSTGTRPGPDAKEGSSRRRRSTGKKGEELGFRGSDHAKTSEETLTGWGFRGCRLALLVAASAKYATRKRGYKKTWTRPSAEGERREGKKKTEGKRGYYRDRARLRGAVFENATERKNEIETTEATGATRDQPRKREKPQVFVLVVRGTTRRSPSYSEELE